MLASYYDRRNIQTDHTNGSASFIRRKLSLHFLALGPVSRVCSRLAILGAVARDMTSTATLGRDAYLVRARRVSTGFSLEVAAVANSVGRHNCFTLMTSTKGLRCLDKSRCPGFTKALKAVINATIAAADYALVTASHRNLVDFIRSETSAWNPTLPTLVRQCFHVLN